MSKKIIFLSLLSCLLIVLLTPMTSESTTHIFKITPDQAYLGMLRSDIPPVLTIDDGDTVIFNTLTLMEGRWHADMTYQYSLDLREELATRGSQAFAWTGPFFINGAEPGDVLEVRIKRIVLGSAAVNVVHPDWRRTGGLPDGLGIEEGVVFTLRFCEDKKTTEHPAGFTLPLSPFLGNMTVAPRPGNEYPPWRPDYFGANMDNKELVAGTTLFLPINVSGALFMATDAHALQGDGEVAGNAAETYAEEVEMQFIVRRDMTLERPMAETPTHWITMGFHEDLREAARIALRDAITFLSTTKGLSTEEAFSLCSLVVDLRITQIVNGHMGVHAMIPKAIFTR